MTNTGKWMPVCIEYKNVDGVHVFTSEDLPGLYIASKDDEAAYRDVAEGIKLLVRLDYGMECEVSPAMTPEEFFGHVEIEEDKTTATAAIKEEQTFSPILSNKMFAVYANA